MRRRCRWSTIDDDDDDDVDDDDDGGGGVREDGEDGTDPRGRREYIGGVSPEYSTMSGVTRTLLLSE